MSKLISHQLYLLSKIRRYLTTFACINIFKTMVLSVIEYCDIIYAGTSPTNLDIIDKPFYRGLRICLNSNISLPKNELCVGCKIAPLDKRRKAHLLIFMHKQKHNETLLKPKKRNTRLQDGPVFYTYKPNNEKAKSNVFYRGAVLWNSNKSEIRNLDFNEFKLLQRASINVGF